jgi:hypothetical protein
MKCVFLLWNKNFNYYYFRRNQNPICICPESLGLDERCRREGECPLFFSEMTKLMKNMNCGGCLKHNRRNEGKP